MREVLIALLLLSSTGCVFVGSYSSERGWLIWPGAFVLLAVTLVAFLLLSRRAYKEKLLRQIDGNLRPNKL